MTPHEVLAYRQNGSAPNTPGWELRVVPNKFPALQVEGTLDRQPDGMFDRMNGIGAHEVIIETPHHDRTLASMSEPEIEEAWVLGERIRSKRWAPAPHRCSRIMARRRARPFTHSQ